MTDKRYYTARLFDFLRELSHNNNREWFHAHKPEFDDLRSAWMADLDRMIAAMAVWSPDLAAQSAKTSASRIYRDTRFSPDKTPYKVFFSAGISAQGRKSECAGYYLQMGVGNGMENGFYGGVWCPDAPTLRRLRNDIVDNIEEFEQIINAPEMVRHYPGWCGSKLKTIPKGWDRNHPQAELLRLKDIGKFSPAGLEFFLDPSWPERAAERFSILKPMIDFLNYREDD